MAVVTPTAATHGHDDALPVVVLSVTPALLESALGRILAAAGWEVRDPLEPRPLGRQAVVAVVSELADANGIDAPVTVVLPDQHGRGGRVLRDGGNAAVPLPPDDGVLPALLQIIDAAR